MCLLFNQVLFLIHAWYMIFLSKYSNYQVIWVWFILLPHSKCVVGAAPKKCIYEYTWCNLRSPDKGSVTVTFAVSKFVAGEAWAESHSPLFVVIYSQWKFPWPLNYARGENIYLCGDIGSLSESDWVEGRLWWQDLR